MFGASLPCYLLTVAFFHGWQAVRHMALFGLIVGAVLSFFMALGFHFLFPTGISARGVSGYSFWGFKRLIGWDQIASVRPLTMANLRWLRLYSAVDGKVTYLALFPSKAALFKSELQRVAPPECPIFKYT